MRQRKSFVPRPSTSGICVCVFVSVTVRVCVFVRACVCACVRACVGGGGGEGDQGDVYTFLRWGGGEWRGGWGGGGYRLTQPRSRTQTAFRYNIQTKNCLVLWKTSGTCAIPSWAPTLTVQTIRQHGLTRETNVFSGTSKRPLVCRIQRR